MMHFIFLNNIFVCLLVYFCACKHGLVQAHEEARGQILVPFALVFETGSFTGLKLDK